MDFFELQGGKLGELEICIGFWSTSLSESPESKLASKWSFVRSESEQDEKV